MSEVHVSHHFDTFSNEAHAGRLGMWIFLSSEALLFAGMFTLYAAGRVMWPSAFEEGVHDNIRWLGSVNTLILITSSYAVASAVHTAKGERKRATSWLLAITFLFGVAFLTLKGFEYAKHFRDGAIPQGDTRYFLLHDTPGLPYFFALYFLMTGAHAFHVLVGMMVLATLFVMVRRSDMTPRMAHRVEVGALYWHLIDIIWIFLWPLFYLAGKGS